MELRRHQVEALTAIDASLKTGHNPAAQLATGTGKSLIIADLAANKAHRTWVLTHSQELVKQNADTYERYTGEQPGIVCAGLNRADYRSHVIFGTIQSVIGPALRDELTRPSQIIVDEAHRVNYNNGESSQYSRLFHDYPLARRIALTATPWRTDNGLIYGTDERFWFDDLCYKYTVPQGVADGWLSPLVGVETEVQLDLEGVDVGDDFVNVQVAERENNEWLQRVSRSLTLLAGNRKHIAVYCPTITAAMRASGAINRATGWSCEIVTGSMSRDERRAVMQHFASGETRVLVSVDTLTTGWDFPALDCLVCLRPTAASNLWVQMLGRLTRKTEGKKNGLVLDFVGNLQRLGGVDMLDTYVRQKGNDASEPIEALPALPREPRKVFPGVRTLAVLDPTSGEQARDGATLKVQVHNVSAVAMNTRRGVALMVNYACTTPENARIDATLFLNTDKVNTQAAEFFARRRLAVRLPVEPRVAMWQVKGALAPTHVVVRKSGRYWNVTEEIWND